ncbi:unnamed protein product [Albugo candida]|uniref:Uncharacterized protein n=1 Tax=Albugo candida TaxID=65357 RepID=A0A024G526_9STRA|nr:unnamed protein product [Albugo candida]|eukprot:CCI41949.1 unnamed protein product [Albugo candida]
MKCMDANKQKCTKCIRDKIVRLLSITKKTARMEKVCLTTLKDVNDESTAKTFSHRVVFNCVNCILESPAINMARVKVSLLSSWKAVHIQKTAIMCAKECDRMLNSCLKLPLTSFRPSIESSVVS